MKPAELAAKRYATKAFDPTRRISDADFQQIKSVLRLNPSSVNSQPWFFVIANDDTGRQRIAQACHGTFEYNRPKVVNASHVIVCCIRSDVSDEYLAKLTAQEASDGRYLTPEARDNYHALRSGYVAKHREQLKDIPAWATHQLFLNMGATLLAAAQLGIDAVPMEGVDTAMLNQDLNLSQRGFTAVALIAMGYAADSDFNAKLPKSRLPEHEIIQVL